MTNYLKNSIVLDVLLFLHIWNKTNKDNLIISMAYEGHNPGPVYSPNLINQRLHIRFSFFQISMYLYVHHDTIYRWFNEYWFLNLTLNICTKHLFTLFLCTFIVMWYVNHVICVFYKGGKFRKDTIYKIWMTL